MFPWLPKYCVVVAVPAVPEVARPLLNSSWLVLVPRGDRSVVPPMKLTVAPAVRTRPALLSMELAPVTGTVVKPAWMVD